MIHAQNTGYQMVIDPVANSGATTAEEIDTLGYDYLTVVVGLGNIGAAVTALKLSEATTSGGSFSDIDAATIGNAACLDIAGSSTVLPGTSDDDRIVVFEVDLKKRERFIKPVVTAGGTANGVFCLAIASRGGEVIDTVAARSLSGTEADIDALVRL